MKKILYSIIATFLIFACNDENLEINKTFEKNSETMEILLNSFANEAVDYSHFSENAVFKGTLLGSKDSLFLGEIKEIHKGFFAKYDVEHPPTFNFLQGVNPDTGNADGSQLGQCANDGVPTGFTQPNTQIRITQGGNPDIQPEESEGINFGVIIKPIEGLSIYADYYEVEITNTISSIGAQLILNGCYQENNQRYCSLIDRNSTGFITDLRDLSNNIGLAETSGAELSVIYEWDDKYGSWIFSSEIAFLDTFDVTRADGSVEHRAGTVNGSDRDQYKEVKGNLGIIWSDNSWSASLSAQYHGEVDGIASAYPKTLSDGSAAIGDAVTKLDATWYLDGQVSYNFDEFSTRVTLGVDNLLDEDPPLFTDSFANDFDPSYRTWGSQFWYARVSSRF